MNILAYLKILLSMPQKMNILMHITVFVMLLSGWKFQS